MSYKIYSLEDDPNISKIINLTLSKQGYNVTSFELGQDFLDAFKKEKPDLVLLDLMLPDIDGLEILKQIRQDYLNDDIQIIIISAKSQILDKVMGLDLGADDYIEKPFDILELISRVGAKIRRKKHRNIINIDNVSLNIQSLQLYVDNEIVPITNVEFKILKELMTHPNQVISREDLIKITWGNYIDGVETRTIDVHINNLRNKLKNHDKIKSIYGAGYKYVTSN